MAIPEGCKEIPDSIHFGRTLLLTPTLAEMGMPKAMASSVYAMPLAPLGSWIERGDPLTRITFVHYRFNDDTSMFRKVVSRLFGASATVVYTATIRSPVSGFNIVVRNAPTRVAGSSYPCFDGLIDFKYALPVLLLPDDEPDWNAYELQNKFREMASYITNLWGQGVHNLGQSGGYKRVSLAQAMAMDSGYNIGTCGSALDVTEAQIEEARKWHAGSESIGKIEWPTCTYEEYCHCKHSVGDSDHFYPLQDYVSEYRAKDDKLRQKLKHLDETIEKNQL